MSVPLELISLSLNNCPDANAQLSDILEENGYPRTPLERYKQYLNEFAHDFANRTSSGLIETLDEWQYLDFVHYLFYDYWNKIAQFDILYLISLQSKWREVAFKKRNVDTSFSAIPRLCFYHDLAEEINKIVPETFNDIQFDFDERS